MGTKDTNLEIDKSVSLKKDLNKVGVTNYIFIFYNLLKIRLILIFIKGGRCITNVWARHYIS